MSWAILMNSPPPSRPVRTVQAGIPVISTNVTFTITDGPGTLTPTVALTDGDGQAKTTLSSNVPGTSTVSASATVYGTTISTGVSPGSSNNATKHWVDARISIGDSGVNLIGDPHTFTVTVEKNDGTAWLAASDVSIAAILTGVGSITSTNPTIANEFGQVTFTVNSNVAGTAILHAHSTVSIGDIDIHVATDGYGAYEVSSTKTWTATPPPPIGSCPAGGCVQYLTVDWDEEITIGCLDGSGRLVEDMFCPSSDGKHSLYLETRTRAPEVEGDLHYLIEIRELTAGEIPDLPDNTTAILAFRMTPAAPSSTGTSL
jgi:hypothetical protein